MGAAEAALASRAPFSREIATVETMKQHVKDFVSAIRSRKEHPPRIVFNILDARKSDDVRRELGDSMRHGAPEFLIDERVVHADKNHPDLTLEDWARLPDVANRYDGVFLRACFESRFPITLRAVRA